jgi:hypothetical protein
MARECDHVIRGSLYQLQTKPPAGLGIQRQCERQDCEQMLMTYQYTPQQCERRKAHQVRPKQWPLVPRRGAKDDVPSAALPCEHCGAILIIYNGDQPEGVTVIDPNPPKLEAETVAASR